MLNTHRATCTNCGALSILRPQTMLVPAGTDIPEDFAIATVARPQKVVMALPVLPPLVWWECGACDTRQRY